MPEKNKKPTRDSHNPIRENYNGNKSPSINPNKVPPQKPKPVVPKP